MPRLLLYAFLFVFLPGLTPAQSTFQNYYIAPDAPILYITNLLDTGDSVIFVGGYRQKNPFIDINKNIPILMGMNRRGKVLWAKEFKATAPNAKILDLGSIHPRSDGHLNVLFSNTQLQNYILYSGTGVMKVSKNGDILGMPTYIDASTLTLPGESTASMQPNPVTGGFILGGVKGPNVPSSSQRVNFCVQLDENGQIIPGPNNQRFYKLDNGDFNHVFAFTDEQQNYYFAHILNDGLSLAKIGNNATGPTWMKKIPLPSSINYMRITGGVPNGDGTTTWVGSGKDPLGYHVFMMKISSEGVVLFCKKYHPTGVTMLDPKVIKNDAGFILIDSNDRILQVDSEGNMLWLKKYIAAVPVSFFTRIIPDYYKNGYWITGAIDRGQYLPDDGFVGRIDLNGNVESCCASDIPVAVSDHTFTTTDLPFSVQTDALTNVEFPIEATEITLLQYSLCAPLNYDISDKTPCTGGCITVLPPVLPPGATASWEFPAGASATFIPGTDSIRICFDNEGQQNLRLNVKLSNDCIFPFNNTISVTNSPLPLTFSLADSVFCPGICTDIQLVNSGPAIITTLGGTAQSGDSLRICYQEAGTYPITVQQIQEGCRRTHTIEVTVQNLLDETPNAFTPNGDQLNDAFRPVIDCVPDTYLLQIFNRWGEMVFQTNDYLAAWDGTYKGNPAPMDTYIWTVNSNNLQKTYKGDVTLIR